MDALVSVVIPTYNRVHDLRRAIESVQKQTYSHWEILVVDNFSIDGTEEMLSEKNDSRIALHKIKNEGVIAASRNLGIKKASGKYIAFLDSDDWWEPNKLEISVAELNAGSDVVYHDLYLVKNLSRKYFLRKVSTRELHSPVFCDLLINGNALCNSSVVVKKNLLAEIGYLSEDPDLIAAEDYDTWLKLSKLTEKFCRLNHVLGYYWAGGGNTSNPASTLRIADAIEVRYFNKTSSTQDNFSWLDYARARAFYSLKSYDLAKRNLQKIQFGRVSFLFYLKAKWMLGVIYLSS